MIPDGQTFTSLSLTPSYMDVATVTASLAAGRVPTSTPATHEVKMVQRGEGYHFEPANLTIERGDRVRFITLSGAPHNIAFEADSIPDAAEAALAAGMPDRIAPLAGPLLLQTGDSYTISFDGVPAGRYSYICMPHVTMGMKGTITVE
jgi:plastocyanin